MRQVPVAKQSGLMHINVLDATPAIGAAMRDCRRRPPAPKLHKGH